MNGLGKIFLARVTDGRRDELAAALRERGIQTLVQFIPNHLQPAFAEYRVDLPATDQVFDEILSLPFYVEMTDADVAKVIDAVLEIAGRPSPEIETPASVVPLTADPTTA